MELDKFAESEVAVAVAVAGLLLAPRTRNLLRRGAVFAMSKVLKAGGALPSGFFQVGRPSDTSDLEDIVARPEPAD